MSILSHTLSHTLSHLILSFFLSDTHRIGTLFRSEFMGTKMMSCFFDHYGSHYLVNTLGNLIQGFVDLDPDLEVGMLLKF